MSIKSDKWIRHMAETTGMIEPFEPGQVRSRDVNGASQKIISYGTSSYGYDIRCAPEFKVFTNIHSTVVDPKNFDAKNFVDFHDDVCIIPPNSFALARTLEYFRIPRNVLTICLGKSTYARCGIIVNVTPFEPAAPVVAAHGRCGKSLGTGWNGRALRYRQFATRLRSRFHRPEPRRHALAGAKNRPGKQPGRVAVCNDCVGRRPPD